MLQHKLYLDRNIANTTRFDPNLLTDKIQSWVFDNV